MIRLTDDELKLFYTLELDLYKWVCAKEGCHRYTKLWRLHGAKYNTDLYAWLRQSRWILVDRSFFLCGDHRHKFKHAIKHTSEVHILKTKVRKRSYSIIQKINK